MPKRAYSDINDDANAYFDREARDNGVFSRLKMVEGTHSKAYHRGSRHYDNISMSDHARAHYGDVYRCK